MKYILLVNDDSKKISEMIEYGKYKNLIDVPKVKNTILTIQL